MPRLLYPWKRNPVLLGWEAVDSRVGVDVLRREEYLVLTGI
jgi:hypothetical protein